MEKFTAEQYRALDADAFELRRSAVQEAAKTGELAVDELRSEVELIKAEVELRKLQGELEGAQVEKRAAALAAVASGAGSVVSAQGALQTRKEDTDEVEDVKNSVEYRKAFMQYVCRGKMSDILREQRDNANTLTTDVSAVIPPVLVDQILEKAESYGMILPLVTKTNYPAGMQIPVASLKPVATWVAEGATSDKQKYEAKTTIAFTHFKLRCEVSISQEVSVMALAAFEAKIVETVARAITVAKEEAIINGDGTSKPKGILKETPADGQALDVAAIGYDTLVDAEAALPEEYEANAKWFMSKKTFMAFVGMTDKQGQPIARVNYGIGGKPERTLLGREVITTGTYLPSYSATLATGTVFAFLFDMSDYVLNSNYDMGISKRQDWDTEDWQTKAVTACDGKVIDVNSLVTLAAKTA